MEMPFGKYKGVAIEDIPSDYLLWLAQNCNDDLIAIKADEEWQFRENWNAHKYND